MRIFHLLLAVTALSLANGASGTNRNSSSSAAATLTLPVELDTKILTPVDINPKKSIWHALDGIPLLFRRKSTRKLSTKIMSNNDQAAGLDLDLQMHRSLAFGDYADISFACPATTTCPLVCVNSTDDCPEDATCALANPDVPDHEFELCNDGTCADLTLGEACDVELESPCTCGGLMATCAKQIDLYDSCFDRFQEYYDENAECVENEAENLPQVDFNGVAFKACYIPLILITAAMFLWCAYNQRWSPVDGSTMELECVSKGNVGERWTQTGYKHTIVGSTLNGLIILVYLAFQGLLLFLTIEYCKCIE